MVVIIKRKYVKPPEKYDKEPMPDEINAYNIRGYDAPPDDGEVDEAKSATTDDRPLEKTLPIYPTAWGWNSEGRAGNITAAEVREPRYTQHSAGHRYIACASGYRHSLLVSDDGSIYSFGDGRKGQLGYGNPFFDKPPKGGTVQVFPRLVNPSGCCKYNRDIKVTEVACGESFSIAREGSQEDGVDLCPGLRALEEALKKIKRTFPECHTVQYAWAQARQERAILSRSFEGKLIAWGTGKFGELGMGKYHKVTTYPQIVPRLEFISIVKVAAGANHVLAISSDGMLYSWGKGKSGRLGHKDNKDQYYPKVVQYFLFYKVESCSAGDAHSAVIMTKRKANRDGSHSRMMATFGRGAHGRLGVGHNRSISFPEVVSTWPPSLTPDYTLLQVSCGGAHTLALAYKNVKPTLANPYGVVTAVYAWGFGTNGQLGVGDNLVDSFVPVKVKMPKWELVCEVSAGRSWSLARTITGELYSWGKGLRGQLGHGKREFCIAPRKVETFASFLALSSKYSHNVTITTTKKIISPKNAEGFIEDIAKSIATPGEDPINVFTAARRRVNMRLANHKSLSMRSFTCCKTNVTPAKANIRVTCITCNLSEVCIVCIKFCHKGHKLVERVFEVGQDATFCKCGVFNEKCRVLPPILEANVETDKNKEAAEGVSEMKQYEVEAGAIDVSDMAIIHTERKIKAAKSLQTLARSYIGKKQIKRMMKYIKHVRRTACENYVGDVLFKAVTDKFDRCV
jgi:alpha-tubulin suppressor-like RCC1 family protein